MKKGSVLLLMLLLACSLMACGSGPGETENAPANPSAEAEYDAGKKEEETMRLFVGETELSVKWEDNESVSALKELVKEQPLSIQMSMYGGFEQVGALGVNLPRNDVQTKTNAGDIVLYSGNQMVMFYGSNSWAYTRLGKVTDMSAEEMTELLSHGDVTVTLSE